MLNRLRVRALAVVLAGVPILAGCSIGTDAVAQGGTFEFVSPGGKTDIFYDPPPSRRVIGDLGGIALMDYRPIAVSDFAGKVVVVNVWGSWCPPCVEEAPALVAAANRTTAIAQFVGLNTRDSGTAQAQAFVRDFKVPYPNLFDPDGRLLLEFAGQLPPSAIPTTLVVDAEGRIAARVLGEVTEATLVGLIEDVAAGRG